MGLLPEGPWPAAVVIRAMVQKHRSSVVDDGRGFIVVFVGRLLLRRFLPDILVLVAVGTVMVDGKFGWFVFARTNYFSLAVCKGSVGVPYTGHYFVTPEGVRNLLVLRGFVWMNSHETIPEVVDRSIDRSIIAKRQTNS